MGRVKIENGKISIIISGECTVDNIQRWTANKFVPAGDKVILLVDINDAEMMDGLSNKISPDRSCFVAKGEGIYEALKNYSKPLHTEIVYFTSNLNDEKAARFASDVEKLNHKLVIMRYTVLTIGDFRFNDNGINVVSLLNRRDILPEA